MNLDELRSVQSKERQTDSLQHLRESFYADVSAYISELERERDRVGDEADDPYGDPEVRRLTDEVETAREVVEAIYERRLGKLVKRASLAAADMPADEDGLTAEERALFDDLVERIETNKARVLDVLDAEAARDDVAADEAAAVAGPDEDHRATDDGGPAPGDGAPVPDEDRPAPPEAGSHGSQEGVPGSGDTDGKVDVDGDEGADAPGLDDRTTVRITDDVDQFYGVDQREYDLDPETVVTLPAENAAPLLESGDAERVD